MYSKLYARITESSLMEERINVRYTFVLMLAIADPEGYVIGTNIAIARRLNMSLAEFEECLAVLMAPDVNSNSKDHDGRRVLVSDGERGYRLVNYVNYRDMKSPQDRRDYMREYMRKRRENETADKKTPQNKPKTPIVNSSKLQLAQLRHAEAEAEAEAEADGEATETETEKNTQVTPSSASVVSKESDSIREVFDHYRTYHPKSHPTPQSKSKEWKAVKARLKEGHSVADLKLAIDGCHRSPFHQGENDRATKYDSLELIVRDSSKVAQFMELANGPNGSKPNRDSDRLKATFNCLDRVAEIGRLQQLAEATVGTEEDFRLQR